MKVTQTSLNGLIVFEPDVYKDSRGHFYESWKNEIYQKAGIADSFVQDNVSISKKNVLRGLHYQKNQGQLVFVSFGKIYDVAVDIRMDSPTYKKHFSAELSDENTKQIYMPPGFAHGFCVLSEVAVVNYKCTQTYSPEDEGGILWSDATLAISWPIKSPVVSEKDQNFPPSLES